jgi:hypothetical protein
VLLWQSPAAAKASAAETAAEEEATMFYTAVWRCDITYVLLCLLLYRC